MGHSLIQCRAIEKKKNTESHIDKEGTPPATTKTSDQAETSKHAPKSKEQDMEGATIKKKSIDHPEKDNEQAETKIQEVTDRKKMKQKQKRKKRRKIMAIHKIIIKKKKVQAIDIHQQTVEEVLQTSGSNAREEARSQNNDPQIQSVEEDIHTSGVDDQVATSQHKVVEEAPQTFETNDREDTLINNNQMVDLVEDELTSSGTKKFESQSRVVIVTGQGTEDIQNNCDSIVPPINITNSFQLLNDQQQQ